MYIYIHTVIFKLLEKIGYFLKVLLKILNITF